MKKGIRAEYRPYCNNDRGKFMGDLILEENIFIRIEEQNSREQLDKEAKRVCKELGLIMVK